MFLQFVRAKFMYTLSALKLFKFDEWNYIMKVENIKLSTVKLFILFDRHCIYGSKVNNLHGFISPWEKASKRLEYPPSTM